MHGSLFLRGGVLYVGRHAKTASIATYDLDGRPLETRFSFRDEAAGRSAVAGLAVDDDHRIWVADTPARKVRAFSLFGQPLEELGGREEEPLDRPGCLGEPVDVLAVGSDEGFELVVASGGVRRHAVQRVDPSGGRARGLRSGGDAQARFEGVTALGRAGSFLFVCEGGRGRIQVFRGGEFHFAFGIPAAPGRQVTPRGVAALADGGLVVAAGGDASALLLFDAAGRLRRELVPEGSDGEDGGVREPAAVVVEEGGSARETRVLALDLDGDRIQVFDLEGRCFGSFPDLPGC